MNVPLQGSYLSTTIQEVNVLGTGHEAFTDNTAHHKTNIHKTYMY